MFRVSACSAVLLLATVWQAGAGDGASFVSETTLTNTVMAPGQTFTNTWTMKNPGTTTWSAGANGYTLNLAGTDSLGAVPLFARTSGAVYLPIATNNSGGSVAPGATATFSMYFIAPETAGTYSDTLQMANVSARFVRSPGGSADCRAASRAHRPVRPRQSRVIREQLRGLRVQRRILLDELDQASATMALAH